MKKYLYFLSFSPSLCLGAFTTNNLTVTSSATIQGEVSVEAVRYSDGTIQVSSPTTISSTTLPSGSTQYIQNTNTLQAGAAASISSITISGQTFFRGGEEVIQVSNTFGHTASTLITTFTAAGVAGDTRIREYIYNPPGLIAQGRYELIASTIPYDPNTALTNPGNVILLMGPNTEPGNANLSYQIGANPLMNANYGGSTFNIPIIISTGDATFAIHIQKEGVIRLSDDDDSNYIEIVSSVSIPRNYRFVLPRTTNTIGMALRVHDLMEDGGKVLLSLALSSAASNTSENIFLMGDSAGGIQGSVLNQLASFSGFVGAIVYTNNLFALLTTGVGFAGTFRALDADNNAWFEFGAPSTIPSSYRFLVPSTILGANQVWSSTGTDSGNVAQLSNMTVIVSTNGLQSGTTFYVSSGSVQNKFLAYGVIASSRPSSAGPPLIVNSTNMVTNLNVHFVSSRTVGTSGNAIPILSAGNTWSNEQTFNDTSLVFSLSADSKAGVKFPDVSGVGQVPTINEDTGISENNVKINIDVSDGDPPVVIFKQSMTHFNFPVTASDTFRVVGQTTLSTATVSSMTVTGQVAVGSVKYPNSTIQVSSPTAHPTREYVIPMVATSNLEASNDSIATTSISTGTQFDFLSNDFDSVTDECRGFTWSVPPEVQTASSTRITLVWFSTVTTGNAGFYIKHNSGVSQGQQRDLNLQIHASSFETVQTSTGADTFTSWEVALSSSNWAAGDVVDGNICADSDNASYTLVGDVRARLLKFAFWMN